MAKRSPLRAGDPRVFVNRAKAMQVANVLRCADGVRGVELFGSLARNGQGNDIDIIIIVDDHDAAEFLDFAGSLMRDFEEGENGRARIGCGQRNGAYHHKILRREAAEGVLGGDFCRRLFRAEALARPADLDIFVFPRNWREQLDVLQSTLPHSDPEFMQNIAQDAVPIA